MPELTLDQIAREIGATLHGPAGGRVTGMATLDAAGRTHLCYAASAALVDAVQASRAAGVIVNADFPAIDGIALLRAAEPRAAFIRALELFVPDRTQAGIHSSAVIADNVRLGDRVGIGPHVVIESGVSVGAGTQIRAGAYLGRDVRVGEGCDIGQHAVLLDDTHVGNRCTLHPGAVLGADGYGYQWDGQHHHKIPQLGSVAIGDDVEIGPNCCIDRATLGQTRIGDGSKLDNLVHIAHNNRIGRHVLLTAQVGIAGSSQLGDGVVIGGQAGVTDHVNVGNGVQIAGQAGVLNDIPDGAKVWGMPARPMTRAMREQALVGKLPETHKRLREQQKEIAELRDRIAALETRLAK